MQFSCYRSSYQATFQPAVPQWTNVSTAKQNYKLVGSALPVLAPARRATTTTRAATRATKTLVTTTRVADRASAAVVTVQPGIESRYADQEKYDPTAKRKGVEGAAEVALKSLTWSRLQAWCAAQGAVAD